MASNTVNGTADLPESTNEDQAMPLQKNVQQEAVTETAANASTTAPAIGATLAKLTAAEATITELLSLRVRTKRMLEKKLAETNQLLLEMPEEQKGVCEVWHKKLARWWKEHLGTDRPNDAHWKTAQSPMNRWSTTYYASPATASVLPKPQLRFPAGAPYRPLWLTPSTTNRQVWLRLGARSFRPPGNVPAAENTHLMVSFPGNSADAVSAPSSNASTVLEPITNWTIVKESRRSPPGSDDESIKLSKRFKRADSSPRHGDDEEDEDSTSRQSAPDTNTEEEAEKSVHPAGDEPSSAAQPDMCVLCNGTGHEPKDCPQKCGGCPDNFCFTCFEESHNEASCPFHSSDVMPPMESNSGSEPEDY